jgi:hypothetical protein
MVRFLICFAFTIVFQACAVKAQHAEFYKEHIIFRIDHNYFYVNGEYYLRMTDTSAHPISLFYPFPTDSIYSKPDSILILNVNKNKFIHNYRTLKTGILFSVDLDSVTLLMISYRQHLSAQTARYILTTTQEWGKPLDEVSYELITPEEMKIDSFSYPPDNQQKIDSQIFYFWQKEYFWPENDMIFRFE